MRRVTKSVSMMLALVLAFAAILYTLGIPVSASTKSKLSKTKLTLGIDQYATVKSNKKASWSILGSAAEIKYTTSKAVSIKAVKEGKSTLMAKIGKKKLRCTITVLNTTQEALTKKIKIKKERIGNDILISFTNTNSIQVFLDFTNQYVFVDGNKGEKAVSQTILLAPKATYCFVACVVNKNDMLEHVKFKDISITDLRARKDAAFLQPLRTPYKNPTVKIEGPLERISDNFIYSYAAIANCTQKSGASGMIVFYDRNNNPVDYTSLDYDFIPDKKGETIEDVVYSEEEFDHYKCFFWIRYA